jgi:hypothetical protein
MAIGVATSGTTRVADYNLGRGIVYISQLDGTSGLPVEYRDIGNVSAFNLSLDVEELIHRSSRSGLSTVDKRITISTTINFNFIAEELNAENLALFFSGASTTATNPAVAGIGQYEASDSLVKGRWYPIYHQTTGVRAMNLTEQGDVTVVHDLAGANDTLVFTTDYTVDLVMGMVYLNTTGSTAVAGNTLHITLAADAAPTTPLSQVRGATTSSVDYALKFIGENPADSDQRYEVELHSVQMTADGDFSLIAESDISQMPISGTAQSNASWLDSNSQTMTITSYDQ